MGAAGFHGRVRNGVGWGTRAMATRSSNHPFGRNAAEAALAGTPTLSLAAGRAGDGWMLAS
jgi:hypothetical protein